MTDRKLLELAARAARFGSVDRKTGELQNCWTESEYPKGSGNKGALWNYVGHCDTAELWNPLTDDGDALRLAVKLNMTVRCYMGNTCAQIGVPGRPNAYVDESNHDDPAAATRHAIVRAAAAIGQQEGE